MSSHQSKVSLSLIIPAYNEAQRLPAFLESSLSFLNARGAPYEIIVVDDGSTDGTAELVLKRASSAPSLKLVQMPHNEGKGAALKAGVLTALGALVLFADADGATPISELPRLEAALTPTNLIACGSRALPSSTTKVETRFYRKYLGRAFNLVITTFLLPGYADTQCGFKLFEVKAAKFLFSRLTIPGFGFDLELLYMARRARIGAVEVPVNWHHVGGSKVDLLVDAGTMFRDIVRIRKRHNDVNSAAWDTFKAT